MTARIAPTLAEVKQYATNVPNSAEVISQSLYDIQSYRGTPGRTTYEFFALPIGAGTSIWGAFAKTLADTNMETPKALPQGVAHLVTSIEIAARGRVQGVQSTRLLWSQEAAAQAGDARLSNEDIWSIQNLSGYVELRVGQKSYFIEGVGSRLFSGSRLQVDGAVSTNSATAASMYAGITGNNRTDNMPFVIDPPIFIPPLVSFSVLLRYEPQQPTPSTGNDAVGCFLNGYRYRYSQ